MSANPRVSVTIPTPVVSVDCHRKGNMTALTVRDLIEFTKDLEDAVAAGLDPDTKVKWYRSTEYGDIYAASASSTIKRSTS